MATISFGTRTGTSGDDLLGANVNFDPDANHYTLENVILGLDGNDILQSMILPVTVDGQVLSFNTTLNGGSGDDNISGNSAGDYMVGGTGNDHISGDGNDSMYGGVDIDTLALQGGSNRNLTLNYAAQTAEAVRLSNGSVIRGFEVFVVVSAEGNDTVNLSGDANAGNSSFQSAGGRDTLILDSATRGGITFLGGDGVDTLVANLSLAGAVNFESVGVGGQLNSTGLTVFASEVERFNLTTGAGNDSMSGGAFADQFVSGGGNDALLGGGGNDQLDGQANRDTLNGGTGNDSLSGGTGRDSVVGGSGNDTLIGGADADTLVGGVGADVFVFTSAAETGFGSTADRIRDFAVGVDKIALDQIVSDPGTIPDPGFAFVTSFTGIGAQVRVFQDTAHNTTVIEGRLAGDAITDFTIILAGLHTLSASDFIL